MSDNSIAALVKQLAILARKRGIKAATAESCTSGLLAKSITDAPGATAHYVDGLIAYADELKVSHLDVNPRQLEEHGAVSMTVAYIYIWCLDRAVVFLLTSGWRSPAEPSQRLTSTGFLLGSVMVGHRPRRWKHNCAPRAVLTATEHRYESKAQPWL